MFDLLDFSLPMGHLLLSASQFLSFAKRDIYPLLVLPLHLGGMFLFLFFDFRFLYRSSELKEFASNLRGDFTLGFFRNTGTS